MEHTLSMSPGSLRSYNRWHLIIALLLIAALFLLPLLFGIGPNSWRECLIPAAPVAAAPVAAPAPAPPPVAAAPAPAPEPIPSAKVYFALDRFDAPTDVDATLGAVAAYLKAHPDAKALLSGFHDPRGAVARNEMLALNRARAVRAALGRLGIPEERVTMNKPQVTTGTGSDEEARRVEVTIQP